MENFEECDAGHSMRAVDAIVGQAELSSIRHELTAMKRGWWPVFGIVELSFLARRRTEQQ